MVGGMYFIWWLVASLVTLPAALSLTRIVWAGSDSAQRECAWVAAFVLGPWIIAAPLWLGAWYGLWPTSGGSAWVLLFALTAWSVPRLRGALPEVSTCVILTALFCAVFCGWTLFRIFNPEIFWGEKPMDFAFLNHLIRAERLPPDDPWAAGHPLNYYYFGHFVWATFHKLTGIDSAFGYNLALSSIGASIAAALWVFARTVGLARWGAVLVVVVVGFGSNLEWIRLLVKGHPEVGFDFFWATSRLITSPVISEYPSWTVLFGDLHAHLCALPLNFLLFAVVLALMQRLTLTSETAEGAALSPANFAATFAWAGLGLGWGVLYATNAWDLIPQVGFFAVLGALSLYRANSWHELRAQGIRVLSAVVFALIGFGIWMIPWLSALGGGVKIEYWWVVQDFSRLEQLVRHFGQFWLPTLIAAMGVVFCGAGWRQTSYLKPILIGVTLAISPLLLGVYVAQFAHHTPPFGILSVAGLIMGVGGWIGTSRSLAATTASALALAAGGLITLCELVYVMDHTNTMFKMYLSIWCWFGLLAILALHEFLKRAQVRWLRITVCSVASVSIVAALVGSAINVGGLIPFQRVSGPRPTLNGLAYLPFANGDEAQLIMWMRENIAGVPVFAEAYGDSYREFGRVSMHTGLPSVFGWDYHTAQRGVDGGDRESRRKALRSIYGSDGPDLSATREALRTYQVRYVVVGAVERRLATATINRDRGSDLFVDLEKFESNTDLFKPIARFGSAVLYRVML